MLLVLAFSAFSLATLELGGCALFVCACVCVVFVGGGCDSVSLMDFFVWPVAQSAVSRSPTSVQKNDMQ